MWTPKSRKPTAPLTISAGERTVIRNIRSFLRDHEISEDAFAEGLGVLPETAHKWIAYNTPLPNVATLTLIVDFFRRYEPDYTLPELLGLAVSIPEREEERGDRK